MKKSSKMHFLERRKHRYGIRMSILLFCFIVCKTIAQKPLRFAHISTEHGLSQNSVLSLAEDKNGFMWIGTQNGLNRYDSYNIKSFYEGPSASDLKGDYILSLFQDHEGRLWIGTNQGLHLYHPESESFTHFLPSTANHPRYNYRENDIMDIAEDTKHRLWIGTKSGILRFYPHSNRFERILIKEAPTSTPIINDIFIDSFERVWLATSTGLFILAEETPGKIKILKRLIPSSSRYEDSVCTSIAEDEKHNYWLGTMNHGLFKLDSHMKIVKKYASLTSSPIDNHVRKLLYTSPDLLIATQNGLFSMSLPDEKITISKHVAGNPQSLAKNSLWSLFKNKEGILWVGSYFGGLSVATPNESTFYTWPNTNNYKEVADPVVSGIVKDKDENIWLSTEGNGLICLNAFNNTCEVYRNRRDKINADFLKTIFLDHSNRLWTGSHGGGINVFSLKEKIFSHYPIADNPEKEKTSETYCIMDYKENNMLFAGNYGIKVGKIANGVLVPQSLQKIIGDATRALLKLKNGSILAGTNDGLYCLNDYKATSIYKQINVNCMIAANNDSLIWIGSKDGLYSYSMTKKQLVKVDKANLLANVLAINDDKDGNIWVSTNNGLYCINKNLAIRHYTVGDGISSNQFNYNATYKDNNGQLYFGGNDGITHFNPKEIFVNNKIAALQLTSIVILDTVVNKLDQSQRTQQLVGKAAIELNHRQNSFTVNFALLNFIEANKNHYAYQLKGYDKSWRTSNIPSATYINLAPGKYKLTIKGFNNDDIPCVMKTLEITILPPWWATGWAYCLYIVVLISLVFGTIRYFLLRYFYKREEEIHQKKLDFFTNVSHEIRTHLTLIIGPLSNLRNKEYLSSNKTIIEVENNANRLMVLVNELMDFRKMESGNINLNIHQHEINGFLIDIHRTFLPIAEFQQIDFEFIPTEQPIRVCFDKEQMEKVFFNLLSNAFKFTPKNGKVSILVSKIADCLLITVADTGKGIDPLYREKIFENYFQVGENGQSQNGYGIGLALSKKIVELHHGTIKLSHSKNKIFNTTFEVTLKLGTDLLSKTETISPASNQSNIAHSNVSHTFILDGHQAKDEATLKTMHEKKLLVVEDNKRMQQLLYEILSPYFEVIISDNGKNGIKATISEMPDLIISDVMMPDLDGFRFCALLKQNIITSHIPVILLTAKSTIEDYIEGLDNSADVYLTKPFDTQILLLHIRNLFSRQAALQLKIQNNFRTTNKVHLTSPTNGDIQTIASLGIKKQDEEFLKDLYRFVMENLDHPDLGVQMLEKEYHMSSPILYKKIQALTGYTIHEFIKIQKLQQASLLLKEGTYNINEITYKVGYSDRKYFSKEFKKFYGITPSEFQKKGAL